MTPVIIIMVSSVRRMWLGGCVAAVVSKDLLNVSDNSVFVVSSLALSYYYGSTFVQGASSLGLFKTYVFTKLTNKPAHVGAN